MRRVALIGKGYWGSKLEKYIRRYFILEYVVGTETVLETIWDDPKIEAVIIATPIETHYDLVKKALLSGKHVLSEKPLTTATNTSKELYQLAIEKDLKLHVDYVTMYSRSLAMIWDGYKAMIGELKSIYLVNKHLGRYMNYDVYWLLASHLLSILWAFTGDMWNDDMKFERKDMTFHNDLATSGFIFGQIGPVTTVIDVSVDHPTKHLDVVLYGEKGVITYSATRQPSVQIFLHSKEEKKLSHELLQREESFYFDESNNLDIVMWYFSEVLEGRMEGNAGLAVRITEILENLYKSS